MSAAPLALAHRAGNDLARLDGAERAGADVVELDVHVRAGRLEVRHAKRLGPLPVHWDGHRLAGPAAGRLVLADVLAAARPETRLLLDLKGIDPRLPRALERALVDVDPRRILLCSRTWPLVDRVRTPGVGRLLSARSPAELRRLLRRLARRPADGVSVHAELLEPAAVRALAAAVPLVLTWAATSRERIAALAGLGVGGFIVDDLELIPAIRSAA